MLPAEELPVVCHTGWVETEGWFKPSALVHSQHGTVPLPEIPDEPDDPEISPDLPPESRPDMAPEIPDNPSPEIFPDRNQPEISPSPEF